LRLCDCLPILRQDNSINVSLLQIVYTTACCSNEPVGDADFLPLQVHYAERFSAAGRTRCADPHRLYRLDKFRNAAGQRPYSRTSPALPAASMSQAGSCYS